MNLPEDPFIRELIPEFVETWINDLNDYYTYEANNQTDELYRMAHTIKGSCYQFGFNDLGDMGIELMGYAKANDWTRSKPLYEKIKSRFNEINDYLNSNNVT
ncbi:MAG: Hpt domain-containing protein [Candidatus Kapabacteria bacterium]|nr:Hpt domain-containing protein [Ignavibacteriota bacterium]MCW5885749.1 Hpt domain-containing protein [Candidatus Kapabacteria bacterium]